MSGFTLNEMLMSSGKRMRQDLAERMVTHPGELGAGREKIVREFLRAYLPKRFEVASGFVFDSTGTVSRQIDVIIADASVSPSFETAGGNRFYPCESVVAVGQIKSSVTSCEELSSALQNLESVKELDRSARGKAIDAILGEEIDHRHNYLHQIFSFLFISGTSLSDETARSELMEHVLSREAHLWPNIIFSLDKYLITYCCDDGVCPNAMHARGIAVQRASRDEEILMRFYLLLGRAIEVTRSGGLPYWEYLHNAGNWSADVFHLCADRPPAYLASISKG